MSGGNTQAIIGGMAKVMISVPDELLKSFDSLAQEEGRTRSGMVQDLMTERVTRGSRPTTEEITARLEAIAGPLGGDSVRLVKEGRPKR